MMRIHCIKTQPTHFHCDLINFHVLTSTFSKCHVAAPARVWEAVAGLAAGWMEANRGRERLIGATPAVILGLVSLLIASPCV